MPTPEDYIAASKRGNELPLADSIDPTDYPIFYDIETGKFFRIPHSKFSNNNRAIDETYLGAVPTAGTTTTSTEIAAHINAQGFTVDVGELLLLKVIVDINSVAYVRYYTLKSGLDGNYGTGNTVIVFTDLQEISEKPFNYNDQTTTTIDLGDVGADPVHTAVNNSVSTYNLLAGTIYVFDAVISSVAESYLYVGTQPLIVGSGGNAVTAADFKLLNSAGTTGSIILLDEDDFASDSDSKGATQQSIKAYIAALTADGGEIT